VGYASPTNPHHHHVEREVSNVAGDEGCGGDDDAESREGLPEPAVPFLTALRLPGVITYAMALFFSKLIAYTFLYWLPFYVGSTGSSKALPNLCLCSHQRTLFSPLGVRLQHVDGVYL
jgi:hypothetical protein